MKLFIFDLLLIGFVFSSDFGGDIAQEINLNVDGIVAAYGDFDSDQATDVFIITNKWKSLQVFNWDVVAQKFNKFDSAVINIEPSSQEKIVSIALGDFNGDGCMDVLLSTKNPTEDFIHVHLYSGNSKTLRSVGASVSMQDQPTLVDVNGDLLPDLFGVTDKGVRSYWISRVENGIFHFEQSLETAAASSLAIPQSNAFVDLTGDDHADLAVKSETDRGTTIFEVWVQKEGSFNLTLSYSFLVNRKDVKYTGRASFVDIDSDGKIDVVLPACLSDDCTNSAFLVGLSVNDNKDSIEWKVLASNQDLDWQFSLSEMKSKQTFPVQIRFGDFSLDGFVDGAIVLQHKNKNKKYIAHLLNQKCSDVKASYCEISRTFQVKEVLKELENPVSVSFFDVSENGGLDFVVTLQDKKNPDVYYTKVYHNEAILENAFLKVAVLSGLCYKDCSCARGSTHYGANQIGSMVDIETTNTDGHDMRRKASQLSQSNYFALQTPYVVFGLGKSPNFVDEISLGIPKGPQKEDRKHSWSAVIPNAQVIVIPFPADNPGQWLTKLLVTPSKLLLQTGGVLLGTCLLIAGIILILHIKEKREDEREKRKEAHKFHFDAL